MVVTKRFLGVVGWTVVFLSTVTGCTKIYKRHFDPSMPEKPLATDGKPVITQLDWGYVQYRQHLKISCYTYSKEDVFIRISLREKKECEAGSLVKNASARLTAPYSNFHATFYIPEEDSGERNFTIACFASNVAGEVTKHTDLCTGPLFEFISCEGTGVPNPSVRSTQLVTFPMIVFFVMLIIVGRCVCIVFCRVVR